MFEGIVTISKPVKANGRFRPNADEKGRKEDTPVVCFSVCSVSSLLGSLQRWCSPGSPNDTVCRCAADSPAVPVHWPHLLC